jgi:DNA-binding MarR family transcriptional regulator
MGLDPSTLTRNLQGLVAAGWVTLGPGPDRRSRRAALTEAGRAQRARGRLAWKQAQLGLNAQLGQERVARLHGLVADCMAALDAEAAGDDADASSAGPPISPVSPVSPISHD